MDSTSFHSGAVFLIQLFALSWIQTFVEWERAKYTEQYVRSPTIPPRSFFFASTTTLPANLNRTTSEYRGEGSKTLRGKPTNPWSLVSFTKRMCLNQSPATIRYNIAAIKPPAIGPATGIHAYPQSLSRLPGNDTNWCTMRGPRSRAGLIA